MGLLQKLKSALGLDGAESASGEGSGSPGDVDVTVEREPSTEDEDAVKGTETAVTDGSETETASTGAGAITDEETAAAADATVPDESGSIDATVPEAEPDIGEGSDDPVTEIKGIGPAYAKRLSGLGIETVGDLTMADAADIAAETDLSESRVAGWIERAEEY
ncbi:helix-hairpin-helix domain-containing protein [Haloarcula amylovorans]|uniref:helix-hairpin-helix domain-containing protein n=1 Tax=Haloarcula amylovorans TaxID=2562280 RepID=UPI0010761339|nr:helix-hairpin-helix domain-containing protein [Halomicroarcula amylolytica]